MERSTPPPLKTFNGGSVSQKPIFNGMEPPFPPKTTLRIVKDASFSSYLRPNPEDAVVQDSEISIFDAQKYFSEGNGGDQKLVGRRVSPVNVANLEQISEGNCDVSSVPRFSSASSAEAYGGRNYRDRSYHATPTASSEASWNSQTGLLSNPPGAIAVSLRNPLDGKKKSGSATRKWFFRRKCPCSGKKSVQVLEEKAPEVSRPTTPSIASKSVKISAATEWNMERRQQTILPNSHRFPKTATETHFQSNRVVASGSGFTFPILINHHSPSSVPPPPPVSMEDPPRDSLEVFQPNTDREEEEPISSNSTTNQVLQFPPPRTARPVDRDCLQSFTFPASPKYSDMNMNMNMVITAASATTDVDDLASDASSDLFEIESFSTQTCSTSYPMYPYRRDSLDDVQEAAAAASSFNNGRRIGSAMYCRRSLEEPATPSIAPTECYEPSEASIDWSVTTAEGFDRASVTNFSVAASEADDVGVMHEPPKHGGGGGGGKRRGNGLLSCRCEKAVSVGPHPVKWVAATAEGQRGSSTWKHVSSRVGSVNKPPLAKSRSARLSLPFAT